jgi:hypothetical protein
MQTFMSPRAIQTERRRKARKRPPSLVYVELGSENGGMMRDLSEEGFALRAMMPLAAGQKTSFSFVLNDVARVDGEGEILWIEENGRVAGVRFIEIPAVALGQIRAWLDGSLDAPKSGAPKESPAAPPAASLGQLRDEIRSTPSRDESRKFKETVHQRSEEIPAPASEASPIAPEAGHAAAALRVPAPAAQSRQALPEVPTIPHTAPQLAPLSLPTIAGNSPAEPRQPAPRLPSISEILIQPSLRASEHFPVSTMLEPLAPLDRAPETPSTNWTEWFTLSRAIAIMCLLVAIVAISAYHREAGQDLIWLGVQMGGNQIRQPFEPDPDAGASNTPSREAISNPPEASQQKVNPDVAAPAKHEAAPSAPVTGNNSQPSLSSAMRNAAPPVIPLSGASSPSSSEASQESGQTEFAQAMQLLHSKNANSESSEAVRLLWVSVEKGNPGAELVLADMYWHGQGVVRNCDQTRILLGAAARKGSAEAQKRLQQFQREGCE